MGASGVASGVFSVKSVEMMRPMMTAKVIESTMRAIAKSAPITLQVRETARMFVAGAV